jgi:hypothetical protein
MPTTPTTQILTTALVTPQPSQTPVQQGPVALPANIDSDLFGILSSEWPALGDAMSDSSTPQSRALEWLSADQGLGTYSSLRKKQRFALATFFFSTNGEKWRRNDGWLSVDDECQWYTTGSTASPCDQDGLYSSLKLNFNDLDGSIPPELALLSGSLTSLDLIHNDNGTSLHGALPSQIGSLGKLKYLNLRGNQASVNGRGPQSKIIRFHAR